MALTSVDFKVTFDLTQDPKVFKIEDTTDYAGQGVALADVTGILKITSPSGTVIYNNTNHLAPDIDPDVSLDNSIPISLPLDTEGEVLAGAYKVDYEVQDTSGAPFVVTDSLSFSYSYESPEINLNMKFVCATPLLSTDDLTSYRVDNTDPTTLVRDHRLQYPPPTGEADLSGDIKLIETNTVYTLKTEALQYSSTLISTLTYDFKGHSVLDAPEGTEYISVLCDPNLCDIYCGMKAQYDRWQNNKGTLQGDKEFAKLAALTVIAQLAAQSIDCSKTDDLSGYLEEIQKIGEFNTDCQCDDGDPILIIGLGGGGTTVVLAGASIDVASVTVGSTTTYTVSVQQALIDQVNALEGTELLDGVQINVTEGAIVSGRRQWDVDLSLGLSAGTMPTVDATGEFLEDGALSYDGTSLLGPLSAGKDIAIGVDDYNLISGTGLGGLLAGTGSGIEKIDGSDNYFVGVVDDGSKKVIMRTGDGSVLTSHVSLEQNSFSMVDGAKNSIVGNGSSITMTSVDGTTSSFNMDELTATVSTQSTLIDILASGSFVASGSGVTSLEVYHDGEFSLGLSARYGGVDSVTIGASSDTSASTLANIAIGKSAVSQSTASNSSIAIGESASVITAGGGISIGKMSGTNSGSIGANAIAIGYQAALGTLGTGANSTALGQLTENQFGATKGISVGNAISNAMSGAIVMGYGVSGASRLVPSQINSFNLGWGTVAPTLTIGAAGSFFNVGSNYSFGTAIAAPSMVSVDGDVEVLTAGQGFILQSPDTTRWRVSVDNAGVLSAVAV